MEQVPPHDEDAEKAILGAVLVDSSVLEILRGMVSQDDFYFEVYRRIYRAMMDLAEKKEPVDVVTVAAALRESDMLERIGGAGGLNEFLSSAGLASNIQYYGRKVSEKAVIRRVLYEAQQITARAYSGVSDFEAFIAESREAIVKATVSTRNRRGTARKIDEDLKLAYRRITEGEEIQGLVKTGISSIDRTTGGLYPGLLTVLAGRPAMGKSCVGLNIAINAAKQGKRVLFITLEDTRYFVVLRLLARYADIDLQQLSLQTVAPARYPDLIKGITRLSGLPFWVDDSSSLTIEQVRTRVAAHKQEFGLDLLVVDHLLEITGIGENETQRVSAVAAGARDCAKELEIPVLMLHQLNRSLESRTDKRPILSDLKQSGKVEEVSRQVWFLYRPAYYDGDDDNERRDIQMIVAKASHGKTGTARLWGDLSRMFVRGWDREIDGQFPGSEVSLNEQTKQEKKPWTPVSRPAQEEY